jgi:outer membrane immunogenic protein
VNMTDTFGFSAATDQQQVRGGYAAGGGIEYKFSPKWTTKLEYQYINLGEDTLTAREFLAGGPSAFAIAERMEFHYHTLRLGVNYRF